VATGHGTARHEGDPFVISAGYAAMVAAAIIAPALFWMGYHYYKDRRRPEPVPLLGLAYLLGLGSGFLGLEAYSLAERLGAPSNPYLLAETDKLGFFVYSVLVIGLLEEAAKFLVFWIVCVRLRSFDERIDGIVYASAVALGFASYENLLYLQLVDGVELVARSVASPLTHAMFSSIWGWAVARDLERSGPALRSGLIGLAVAAIAHGVYDFLILATHPFVRPLPALIVLGIWIWRMRLTGRLDRR
jgi:RsiW-degrading membrane proteinase PrsW (M82 family)